MPETLGNKSAFPPYSPMICSQQQEGTNLLPIACSLRGQKAQNSGHVDLPFSCFHAGNSLLCNSMVMMSLQLGLFSMLR
jgi:hypothetical protein